MYEIELMYQCTDARGDKVIVGDRVAFAVSQMSVAVLKIGNVVKIEQHKGHNSWQQFVRVVVRTDSKTFNLDYPGRLVKLDG